MSQPICVLCAYYHPRADPHRPDRGQTCATGRGRLEHDVFALRAGYLRLLELHALEQGANDAISALLPAAPVRSPSNQPTVSGSRERRIPLTDVADLTAAAQLGSVTDPHRDQVGQHSVASVLNEWVRSWHERFFANQTRPVPAALTLLDWILGVRLELLCDADDAIADFAEEVRALRGVIRYHLGDVEKQLAVMWGVTCPRCDKVSQLMLDPEDPDEHRECAWCGLLLTRDDYHLHLRALVDDYAQRQDLARGQKL